MDRLTHAHAHTMGGGRVCSISRKKHEQVSNSWVRAKTGQIRVNSYVTSVEKRRLILPAACCSGAEHCQWTNRSTMSSREQKEMFARKEEKLKIARLLTNFPKVSHAASLWALWATSFKYFFFTWGQKKADKIQKPNFQQTTKLPSQGTPVSTHRDMETLALQGWGFGTGLWSG